MYPAAFLSLIFLRTGFSAKLNVKVKFIFMWYLSLALLSVFFFLPVCTGHCQGHTGRLSKYSGIDLSEGHMERNFGPGFGLSSCGITLLTIPHSFWQGPLISVYFWKHCTKVLDGLALLKFTVTHISFFYSSGTWCQRRQRLWISPGVLRPGEARGMFFPFFLLFPF